MGLNWDKQDLRVRASLALVGLVHPSILKTAPRTVTPISCSPSLLILKYNGKDCVIDYSDNVISAYLLLITRLRDKSVGTIVFPIPPFTRIDFRLSKVTDSIIIIIIIRVRCYTIWGSRSTLTSCWSVRCIYCVAAPVLTEQIRNRWKICARFFFHPMPCYHNSST